MDSAQERKLDRLLDYLYDNKEMLRRGPSSSSSSSSNVDTSSYGGIFDKIGGTLLRTVENAGQLVGKAYDNTATVSDASKAVSKVLGEFGTVGNLAGSALDGLTSIITDTVENWQNFSNFGLQMGGDAIALNEAVKKTGLSFREYESILEKLTPAFTSFGEGLNRGAETFAQLSNSVLNSPAIQRQFNLLGMNTKDVNEALATVVRGAGMIDTNNKQQMDGVIQSALRLAKEMDMMAKLTGISRKEQEKAIETMQNDERVRARLVMLRKENPAAVADIGRVQQAAGALDPATQKVLMESIAGKGIMSSNQIAEFRSVFGPEAVQKIAEIGRMTTSEDANERERAVAETKELLFLLTKARENGAAFVATGAVSSEFSKAAYSDRYDNVTKNLDKYTKLYGEAGARIQIQQEAEALAAGKLIENIKDAQGNIIEAKRNERGEYITDDPRRKTTELVTDVNTEIKRFSTSLSEIVGEMNRTLTLQRDANGKFIMTEATAKTAGFSKKEGSKGSDVKDMTEGFKAAIRELAGNPENKNKTVGELVEEAINKMTSKRELGSKKTTGSWFESGPQLVLAGEGKEREAFVPENQVEEFMKDMASLAQGSTPSFRSPNMSNILKSIKTKVSSAQEAPVEDATATTEINEAQDKVVDKLSEISSVLAANLSELRAIAGHTRDAASNTKDMGGYIG